MDTKIPVILIHGYASSSTQWTFQLKALEKNDIKSIAVDLLGHGEGSKPENTSDYNIDNLYRDFVDRFIALDINAPVVLMGHSLGAYISLKFAVQYPEKVKKMILLAPFTNKDQIKPGPLRLILNYPLIGSMVLRLAPFWLIRLFICMDKVNSAGLPEKIIDNVALDYKRADPRITYIGNSLVDISSFFKEITQPTLVIWGDKDDTLQRKYFFDLINQLSNSEEHCVHGGGHTFQLTHSKEVDDLILSYL